MLEKNRAIRTKVDWVFLTSIVTVEEDLLKWQNTVTTFCVKLNVKNDTKNSFF